MMIIAFAAIWLGCGLASWFWQIRLLGWGTYDALMIGPVMLSGPIGLYIVARSARDRRLEQSSDRSLIMDWPSDEELKAEKQELLAIGLTILARKSLMPG